MSYPAAGTSYAHDFSTPIDTFPTPSQLLSSLNQHDISSQQRAARSARREKRRKARTAQLSKDLGYTPTDPDLISSHDKKRYYLDCLEHYVLYLHDQLRLVGHEPVPIERVSSGRGLTSRSIRTIIVHLQKNASQLHAQRLQAESQYHSARDSLHSPVSLPPSLSRDPSSSSSSLSEPDSLIDPPSNIIPSSSPSLSSPLSSTSTNSIVPPSPTSNFIDLPCHFQPLTLPHLSYTPEITLNHNNEPVIFGHDSLPINLSLDPIPSFEAGTRQPHLTSPTNTIDSATHTPNFLLRMPVPLSLEHSQFPTLPDPYADTSPNLNHNQRLDYISQQQQSLLLQRRHSIATAGYAQAVEALPLLTQSDPRPHPHSNFSAFNSAPVIVPPTLPNFSPVDEIGHVSGLV